MILIAIVIFFFIGFLLILKSFIFDDTSSGLEGIEALGQWWTIKRAKYNISLIISGALAFVIFLIVGLIFRCPSDDEFEITLFTIVFQGFGLLLFMLIANVFFSLGYFVDRVFNKKDSQHFRERLFAIGLWFSVSLPFLIPLLTVVKYLLSCYE
jgi:hypothetical protein